MGLELDKDGKPYISRNGFGPLSETDLGTGFIKRCLAVDNEVHPDEKKYRVRNLTAEEKQEDAIKQLIDGLLSKYCKDLSLEEISRVLKEPTAEIHELVNNLIKSSYGSISGAKDYQEAVEKIIDIASRHTIVITKETINKLASPCPNALSEIKEYTEVVKELSASQPTESCFKIPGILNTKLLRYPDTGHISSMEFDSITNPGIVKGSVSENNFNIITGNFNNIASKIEDDNSFKFPGVSVEGISPTIKLNHKIHGISFDVNQGDRTAQFGLDYKISKVLLVVDKHLDVAPNGYVIKTYDDKKGKNSSWEAELVLEIDSIGSNNSGYGNIDTRIVGYGKTKEEALEDLDKLYLHMLNKFLMINKY